MEQTEPNMDKIKSDIDQIIEPKLKWTILSKHNSIVKFIVFYGLSVIMHYIAANIYAKWCAPLTWTGVIESMFLTTTPHCQCLRWIINMGGNNINNMWLLIAGWILLQIKVT